jgi:hypothetical protein
MLLSQGDRKFQLDEVLADPQLLEFFRRFCAINYEEESVLCHEHISLLKAKWTGDNDDELRSCLQKFVDVFVTGDDTAINISGALRARWVNLRSDPEAKTKLEPLLADVSVEVYRMLQNSFVGFSKVLTRATRTSIEAKEQHSSSPERTQAKKVKAESIDGGAKAYTKKAISLRLPKAFSRRNASVGERKKKRPSIASLSCGCCNAQHSSVTTCCKMCKSWCCTSCLSKGKGICHVCSHHQCSSELIEH